MPDLAKQAELPTFKYFPNPVAHGIFEENPSAICPCCKQQRGWVYVLHPYAVDEISDLCPWCIADGSAAALFDAEFNDVTADLPQEIVEEVSLRTPGFPTWQQNIWLTHCNDAGIFLGNPTWEDVQKIPGLSTLLCKEGVDKELQHLLGGDSSLTAYLFQCTQCHQHMVYTDCD